MWSNLWKNCFWEIALTWLTLRGAGGRSQSRQMFRGVYNTSVDRCVNIKPQSVDASVPAGSEFLFFWTFSRMLHIVLFFSVKQQVGKEFWLKAASQGRPFPPPKLPLDWGVGNPTLGLIRVHIPNSISIGSAILAQLMVMSNRLTATHRHTHRPRNVGNSRPHLALCACDAA